MSVKNKIKAIVLDVDGVIIGERVGFNSPYPHPNVIKRLKEMRQKGIAISLCTAKPHYSVQKIIDDAGLDNLHITNGGGVIIDPVNNLILKKHIIDKDLAKKVIRQFIGNGVYIEFYSVDDYFIQKNQVSNLTEIHRHILQRKPQVASSLVNEVDNQDIVKIVPIAKDEEDKKRLTQLFEPFQYDLTLSWGIHPVALPHLFGIITAKGISKKQAVLEIANNIGITPKEILGIGDSMSDWQFMELCGYAGAMGNATDDLKQLVKTKGDNSFVGGSVDENGVLDIFDYFSL